MNTDQAKPFWRRILPYFVIGAVSGSATAVFFPDLMDEGILPNVSVGVIAGLGTGALYLFFALILGVGLVSPNLGQKLSGAQTADDLRDNRAMISPAAVAMAAFGAALIILASSGSQGSIDPILGATLTVVLLVVGGVALRASMAASDELYRTSNNEAASVGYYIAVAVLGSWGILSHTGFFAPPGGLDVLTTFYWIALTASVVVSYRRGMLDEAASK